MAIQWDRSLAVGVRIIDEQHQELFARVRVLRDALVRDDRGEVGRMLVFLGDYVVRHFGTEEREMLRTSFPGYMAHKAAHDAFVKELQSISATYVRSGATPWLTLRLNGTVRDWLVQHILGMDQELGKHLAAAPRDRPRPDAW